MTTTIEGKDAGAPVDPGVLRAVEPHLGVSLRSVRVHHDAHARVGASAIGARAFAHGRDVFLGPGESPTDLRLMAHELAHTAQHRSSTAARAQPSTQVGAQTSPAEREAEAVAARVVGGAPVAAARIVPDTSTPAAGQLRRSEFLSRLRSATVIAADEALGPIGSALGCPYIERWFQAHAGDGAEQIERLARRFSGVSGVASAIDYIAPIVLRLQRGIRRWRGGQDISSELTAAGLDSSADAAAELGEGAPLPRAAATRMGDAFGEDFAAVRVHTDAHAARLADSHDARAVTFGNHIAFADRQFQPGRLEGDAVLAHELAHVVQQRGAASSASSPRMSETVEDDADQAAGGVLARLYAGSAFVPASDRVKPALTSGLELRRCRSKPEEPKKIAAPPNPAAVYEARLREGIQLLSKVPFGRCDAPSGDYDVRYWQRDTDTLRVQGHMLRLKAGVTPSKAIDEMFGNLHRWSFDCAQFVQVAELYALRHSLGDDAFNTRMAGLRLRVQFSTGLAQKALYVRNAPDDKFTLPDGKVEARSADEILSSLPVGSRVTWTNLAAERSSDFRNENAIKLGPDEFAAHGFTGKSVFSRKALELELARVENGKADAAYVKENVFISVMEVYDTPNQPP